MFHAEKHGCFLRRFSQILADVSRRFPQMFHAEKRRCFTQKSVDVSRRKVRMFFSQILADAFHADSRRCFTQKCAGDFFADVFFADVSRGKAQVHFTQILTQIFISRLQYRDCIPIVVLQAFCSKKQQKLTWVQKSDFFNENSLRRKPTLRI